MENIHNQPNNQAQNRPPMPPVVTPIKRTFENYSEKSDYYLDIPEQIRLRRAQIAFAETQSATNPTASPKAYADLIAMNENEIKELERQKIDMLDERTTKH